MNKIVECEMKREDLRVVNTDVVLYNGKDDHGTYFISVTDEQDDETETHLPAGKVPRLDDDSGSVPSLQDVLSELNKSMCCRLDVIENKLDALNQRTKLLEEQMSELVHNQQSGSSKRQTYPSTRTNSGAVIIGIPQEKSIDDDDANSECESDTGVKLGRGNYSFSFTASDLCSLGPNVTLITLNTEEDYPNGSWLGNEDLPDQRVRVPISQSDLLHVEANCQSPEKMALALLDYLFDRDTQACSNISGLGKHGKKPLDPLFVYGIRCHLVSHFSITEKDWHRIKLNIDSKCRTAFRRKMRGQPMTVKAFRGKNMSSYVPVESSASVADDDADNNSMSSPDNVLHIGDAADISQTVQLLTNHQFQIITASPDQLAHLKPRFQLLHDGQLAQPSCIGGTLTDCMSQGVTLSSADVDVSIVKADNGDIVQILSDTDAEATAIDTDTGVSQIV